MSDNLLTLDQVCVDRQGQRILSDISFAMTAGELISVVGPSGCGKTTLIDTMMGFHDLARGRITLDQQQLADTTSSVDPGKRGFGAVFQHHNLFPHLNVRDNILYSIWSLPREQKKKRLDELSQLVGLEDKLERAVTSLSGGEKQRVAIARGLAPHPQILFLDEPFSSLDRLLRLEIRAFMKHLLKELGIGAFLVTHDKDDAFHFSDRVMVLQAGKVVQMGTPRELYQHPVSDFVLNFFGSNIKSAVDGRSLSPYQLELCDLDAQQPGREVEVLDCYFVDGRYCYRLKCRGEETPFDLYGPRALVVGSRKKMIEVTR